LRRCRRTRYTGSRWKSGTLIVTQPTASLLAVWTSAMPEGSPVVRHQWNISPEEARAVQTRLAPAVSTANSISQWPTLVAGLAMSPPDDRGWALAAAALLSLPDLQVQHVQLVPARLSFPYVPGLRAFREAPWLLEALQRLNTIAGVEPDFVIVNGHGLAHPRGFGLACHLGVLTGLPTIGFAKTPLLGNYGAGKSGDGNYIAPGLDKSAWSLVSEGEEVLGAVVRTKQSTQPVYVSVGHKVDLPAAVRWTLACCSRYRVPEPLREALRAARAGNRPPFP